MDLQLKGKTTVVAGASLGIGRAIARLLAAEGVECAIAARRITLLEELANEIAATGAPRPTCFDVDVLAEGTLRKLAGDAIKALGTIEIPVNSAGGSRSLPVDAPKERWAEAMTSNFARVRQLTYAHWPATSRAQRCPSTGACGAMHSA